MRSGLAMGFMLVVLTVAVGAIACDRGDTTGRNGKPTEQLQKDIMRQQEQQRRIDETNRQMQRSIQLQQNVQPYRPPVYNLPPAYSPPRLP